MPTKTSTDTARFIDYHRKPYIGCFSQGDPRLPERHPSPAPPPTHTHTRKGAFSVWWASCFNHKGQDGC